MERPCYRIFGLTVGSTISLPHLSEVDCEGEADVQILTGNVPHELVAPAVKNPLWQARKDAWLWTNPEPLSGRVMVRDGCQIIVDENIQAGTEALPLFLSGSCMKALLLQRGLLPMHANAVCIGSGAILLAGPVGAGKSTTSLAMSMRGYRLISDDLSAVCLDGTRVAVHPGIPVFKLWDDACRRFGLDTDLLERVWRERSKYHWPADRVFSAGTLPVRGVYLLVPQKREDVGILPIVGEKKFRELQAHLYKISLTDALKCHPRLFDVLSGLANGARVCIVRRPLDMRYLPALVDCILNDLTRRRAT